MNKKLIELLDNTFSEAKNGFVDLVLEYDYDYPGHRRLLGTSTNGSTMKAADPCEPVYVTIDDMGDAFGQFNVGLKGMPIKWDGTANFNAHGYRLSQDWNTNLSWAVWTSKPLSARAVERNKSKDAQRSMAEARFGPMTDEQYESFVKGEF